MKALIVDDDPDVAEGVALCFEIRWPGAQAVIAPDGESGLRAFREGGADIVVLDRHLPDMDGVEICRQLRERSNVPIIMLTVCDRPGDIVRGLESGADDYITKPFDQVEFMARASSVLRRARTAASRNEVVLAGGRLTMEAEQHRVAVDGEAVSLTPTEYALLEHLAATPGRVVTHEQLLQRMWGRRYVTAIDYLKVHVMHLRRKLHDDPASPFIITTQRGFGYKVAA